MHFSPHYTISWSSRFLLETSSLSSLMGMTTVCSWSRVTLRGALLLSLQRSKLGLLELAPLALTEVLRGRVKSCISSVSPVFRLFKLLFWLELPRLPAAIVSLRMVIGAVRLTSSFLTPSLSLCWISLEGTALAPRSWEFALSSRCSSSSLLLTFPIC